MLFIPSRNDKEYRRQKTLKLLESIGLDPVKTYDETNKEKQQQQGTL